MLWRIVLSQQRHIKQDQVKRCEKTKKQQWINPERHGIKQELGSLGDNLSQCFCEKTAKNVKHKGIINVDTSQCCRIGSYSKIM